MASLLAPIGLTGIHVALFGYTLLGLSLFTLGVLSWTLVEYGLHRLAHVIPWLQMDHWAHHEHPRDPNGPSKFLSGGIALGILGGLWVLVGFFATTALGAGFLLGYAAFVMLHYAVHHFTIGPSNPLYGYKMMHVRHHAGRADVNFGVTTILWDRVFGTA